MKFRAVYKILSAFIFYPEKLCVDSPNITIGPFVFISKKHNDKIELEEHGLVHVKQFYRTFGFVYILYLSKNSRFKLDIEAYKRQLEVKIPGNNNPSLKKYLAGRYGEVLANKYKIGLNKKTIRNILLGKFWVH